MTCRAKNFKSYLRFMRKKWLKTYDLQEFTASFDNDNL